MKISSKSWKSYVDRLSKIDQIAAGKVSEWYRNHPDADIEELINVTYYYCDHYGDAAGALACEMYDEMAMASGKTLPPAEPARTATYGEVASALQGALLKTQDPDAIGAVAGRKVKTVGLDTLLNNSLRDGAEFAWIPSGDTCAFCIMLASNGWQRASKKALKHGHASHVHNNCDCTYAIRFGHDTEVEGYDPDYYKRLYDEAVGDNWKQKVNSIRRNHYAANRERINKQKREAYAKRKGLAKTDDNDIIKTRNISSRYLANNRRSSRFYKLTPDDIESVSNDATAVDIPISVLRFNYGVQTGFDDRSGFINIRGDIFPDLSSRSNRDLLSVRCVLAHEYYGHYMSHPSSFRVGDWRDEFRASYKAAIYTPNLTDEERRMLMIDAYDRAKEAGVSVSYSVIARRIIHGYD